MPEQPIGVVELINDAMPKMSSAERRVARVAVSEFPGALLGSVGHLAQRAEVSPATVVRFSTRLGLSGFAELNARVREEVSQSAGSPVSRVTSTRPPAPLDVELAHRAELVGRIGRVIPAGEIERLLELLSDTNRALYLTGGTLSGLAAQYLQLQLRHVRPRVTHLADPLQADIGTVLDIHRRDILIVFDFRRYEPRTERLAKTVKEHGATLVLFTDTWLSPIARIADIVIPFEVEASFLDSLAGLFATVEAIVPVLAARLGDAAVTRMSDVETLRLPTYRPDA